MERGYYDNLIDQWNAPYIVAQDRSDWAEMATGWAVACVGTSIVRYWDDMRQDWTADEQQATVYMRKQDAANVLAGRSKRLFRYLRLVAVDGKRPIHFPTVRGH